jgi:hypothetical protein
MLERSGFWLPLPGLLVLVGTLLAGCVAPEPVKPVAPVAVAPPAVPEPPPPDPRAKLEESRAFVAQAETDVQRARVKRALWSRAWEALLAARAALAAGDGPEAIRNARRASDFAQLGLEQLAYPALKP